RPLARAPDASRSARFPCAGRARDRGRARVLLCRWPSPTSRPGGMCAYRERIGMAMSLPPVRLYNTYTRSRQELKPLADRVVQIYSCGPTVYRYVHVGNLRTFMVPDLLRRSLEYLGYRTRQFMNITDVGHLTNDSFDRGEDKMLVSARLENRSTEEIAAHYTDAFLEDIRKVNIRLADGYPRATDHIAQMQGLIEKLITQGHAYVIDG